MVDENIKITDDGLDTLQDASPGECVKVKMIDGDGNNKKTKKVQIMGKLNPTTVYGIEMSGRGACVFDLFPRDNVVAFARDGPEIVSETEDDVEFKTGTNPDGSDHYELGKSESITLSFDFWVTDVSREESVMRLG
jgi:hypothetical protein